MTVPVELLMSDVSTLSDPCFFDSDGSNSVEQTQTPLNANLSQPASLASAVMRDPGLNVVGWVILIGWVDYESNAKYANPRTDCSIDTCMCSRCPAFTSNKIQDNCCHRRVFRSLKPSLLTQSLWSSSEKNGAPSNKINAKEAISWGWLLPHYLKTYSDRWTRRGPTKMAIRVS